MSSNPGWVPVDSSAISAIAYDAGTQSLYVRFLPSDAEYVYENVTAAEHTALVTAPSIGKAFNSTIKKTHPFQKIEHEPK